VASKWYSWKTAVLGHGAYEECDMI
jgi:hypothetical protein